MLNDIDLLVLTMRWLHLLAAILLAGGTMFWRFVWIPAAENLDEATQADVRTALLARWSRLVMIGTGLLLISGLINFYRIMSNYELGRPYHMVFGVKFLIAMVIFYIAARLSGRSEGAARFREKSKFWLSLNLVLAVMVVCLAGYLKMIPHQPKQVAPDAVRIDAVGGITTRHEDLACPWFRPGGDEGPSNHLVA